MKLTASERGVEAKRLAYERLRVDCCKLCGGTMGKPKHKRSCPDYNRGSEYDSAKDGG